MEYENQREMQPMYRQILRLFRKRNDELFILNKRPKNYSVISVYTYCVVYYCVSTSMYDTFHKTKSTYMNNINIIHLLHSLNTSSSSQNLIANCNTLLTLLIPFSLLFHQSFESFFCQYYDF